MNEKMLMVWQKVEAYLRVIIFVVFVAMLSVVIYLQLNEHVESVDDAKAQVQPLPPIPENLVLLQKRKTQKISPIESSEYAPLIRDSMFNVKAIKDAIKLEAQANERYEVARTLFEEGRLDQALVECNRALSIRPQHLRARNLILDIQRKLDESKKEKVSESPEAVPGS